MPSIQTILKELRGNRLIIFTKLLIFCIKIGGRPLECESKTSNIRYYKCFRGHRSHTQTKQK